MTMNQSGNQGMDDRVSGSEPPRGGAEGEARGSGLFASAASVGPRIWLALLVPCAALVAWNQRFLMDDAYISFRYAENWASGHGLVFNLGERVEGYTNFLWTWILGCLRAFGGADLETSSQVLGVLSFSVALVASHRLASLALADPVKALCAPALLATHYSFVRFATGGLETSTQAALITLCFALACGFLESGRPPSLGALLALGLLATAAVLLRLDSALPVGLASSAALVSVGRLPSARRRFAGLAALSIPGLLLILIWLFYKAAFYGDLLPNTFYAKATGVSMHHYGLAFLGLFARQYFLLPLLPLWLIGAAISLRRLEKSQTLLVVAVLSWCAYMVKVGGGFMEFRLLMPVLPLFAVSLVHGVFTVLPRRRVLSLALLAILPVASAVHASSYRSFGTVLATSSMAKQVDDPSFDWSDVGRALRHFFGQADEPVVIAATPIGAIGYFSNLPLIDMHGLVDPWVARHGALVRPRPGHLRLAPLAYLQERGVHFVVGQPSFNALPQKSGFIKIEDVASLVRPVVGWKSLGRDARFVSIPMPGLEGRLNALYLTRSEEIDRLIAQNEMPIYEIVFPQESGDREGG
ncbi:MAG: hypothetical protein AAF725_13920 [Acidobacteriota bacterium]